MSRVPSHIAFDPMADPGIAYLWLDAGQTTPLFRRWTPAASRAVCNSVLTAYAAACLVTIMVATASRPLPFDATAHMEQLAEELARRAIPEHTAAAIARLIQQPRYDCRRFDCDAVLETRNRVARARLNALMAERHPYGRIDRIGRASASVVP
jgi:hypothetical protein